MQDPQSLHKYLYVHGDPINGVDPSGRLNVSITLATISVYSSQIAMTVGAGAYVLTSTYGAAGWVMLHDELIGLFSAVHSIGTGRGEDGEQLTMAGYMFAFALLAITVVPGDFADDALRQISAFRAARNLPTQHTGNRAADGVVAVLRIDGDDYIAHNKWMSDEGTNLVDDDQSVAKDENGSCAEDCKKSLRTLDGVNRVYLICRIDDETSVTVIGNGDRFVLTHEISGNARWLRAKGCDEQELVEIVKDDPTKVFRFNMTVSFHQAARALDAICEHRDVDDDLCWK